MVLGEGEEGAGNYIDCYWIAIGLLWATHVGDMDVHGSTSHSVLAPGLQDQQVAYGYMYAYIYI